jgi:hypothetical protein
MSTVTAAATRDGAVAAQFGLDPPTSLMPPRMLWRELRKGSLAA